MKEIKYVTDDNNELYITPKVCYDDDRLCLYFLCFL